jgi:hypothetical protein
LINWPSNGTFKSQTIGTKWLVTWCWRKEEILLETITMVHYDKVKMYCYTLWHLKSITSNLFWLHTYRNPTRVLEGQGESKEVLWSIGYQMEYSEVGRLEQSDSLHGVERRRKLYYKLLQQLFATR